MKQTPEEIQLRREELQLLEGNQIHQLLLIRLQALRNSKRREQREAAFNNKPDVSFGCEWALWGLEQVEAILENIKKETIDRPEKTIKY